MKSKIYLVLFLLFAGSSMLLIQCSSNNSKKSEGMSQNDMIVRGKYLVNYVAGCPDCHSPKVFTEMGPMPDTSRFLSGHPAEMGIPHFDTTMLSPGKLIMATQDFTVMAGPWGISFPINLTPDSITGIGAWSEDAFLGALRTGKHMGTAAGRPILPPMPWQSFSHMTDEDLKSIYAYLRTLPPISNKVPEPVPFNEIGKPAM